MTKYNTTAGLFQKILHIITGEVDISVCYFGVCIFVWEDKSLDKSLLPAVEKSLLKSKASVKSLKNLLNMRRDDSVE